jgi:hypothetical protein
MTDDEYAAEIDAEAVARARSKRRFPDMSKVRRVDVRGAETPDEKLAHELAQAANTDREREGDTE